MKHRTQPFILRVLLSLMLALGPLQAQTVFACAMMETLIHGDCCCEDHENCVASNCGAALESTQAPCCEQSVELDLNHDEQKTAAFVKRVETRSGIDPPVAIAGALDFPIPPQSVAARIVYRRIDFACRTGSDTYLRTQRLRI
jgi:hypothetical protein